MSAHGVVWLLAAMLVLVPPSGAVCWPLADGWHIHIGWSDAAGRPTAGVVVYVHRSPTRMTVDPHALLHSLTAPSAGFSTLLAPDVVNLSDLRLPATGALWLLLLTLCWLCLRQNEQLDQPELAPWEHPPKSLVAA